MRAAAGTPLDEFADRFGVLAPSRVYPFQRRGPMISEGMSSGWSRRREAGRLSDTGTVAVVVPAAHRLGMAAYALDWAIWEHGRGGPAGV